MKRTHKTRETRLDVQGHFNAYLSNVVDVLTRLTFKFHQTLNTAGTCYINSIKNLKTPSNTHKHIGPHFIHLGDLVVKRLSRPLTFDSQHL